MLDPQMKRYMTFITKRGKILIDPSKITAIEEDRGKVYVHAMGLDGRVELDETYPQATEEVERTVLIKHA